MAGNVNVAGFFAVQRLTTNVTGHFAFFVDEVFRLNFWQGFVYFLYIFFFFFGAFVSGLFTELVANKYERLIYVGPIVIECIILMAVGCLYPYLIINNPDVIACCLLFAMGLQNSLVTVISNAIVRTTHLTGLFTDLGIELSQLFFCRSLKQNQKLVSSIKLRLTIISFFFLGGVTGGMLYAKMNLYDLIIVSVILLIGLIYDSIKFNILKIKRRYKATDSPK